MTPQGLTTIEIFSMKRRIDKYENLIDAAFSEVLTSGSLVLGKQLTAFEDQFANFIGVKHCIGVANGTDALEFALKSLNLDPDTLVATVANAGNYATTSILACGLTPLFIDITSSTQLTSLQSVHEGVAAGAKALIITHLYGMPVSEIQQIANFCSQNSVFLIEDCAQAHGAKVGGTHVGTFGDLSTFSFYPTKNLGALGDGGMVATNNIKMASTIRSLRNYGWGNKYEIEVLGGRNSRLDEIQAAVLMKLLPFLTEENKRRGEIAHEVKKHVDNEFITFLDAGIGSVFHLFVLLTDHRTQLQNHLSELGIQTGIHYPINDSRQIGRETTLMCNNLSNSYRTTDKILTIPMHPYLTTDEILRITESLNSFIPR